MHQLEDRHLHLVLPILLVNPHLLHTCLIHPMLESANVPNGMLFLHKLHVDGNGLSVLYGEAGTQSLVMFTIIHSSKKNQHKNTFLISEYAFPVTSFYLLIHMRNT